MTFLNSLLLAATLTMLLSGCSSQQARVDTHETLNAALWTQTSAEYAATTLQAYQLAAANLDQALADTQWTAALEQGSDFTDLPPAIMLDLDQTVLDTSRYNARIILEYGSHGRDHFAEWCRQSTAPAIPGVKAFVDHATARGVTVIYNSARGEALRDCTARNLRALGLPLPGQERLLLNDGTPLTSKTQQRARTAAQYRVLLLVGDNLNDFVSDSKTDPDTRRALVDEHADRWGREWIILPNPMYGNWEASLYAYDYSLPRDERLHRLLQQLQQ
ncbi:MAG: HAD family acid phosphatase [Gammaproteobacteria bacterium]|jgi:acid phosphatase